MMLHTATSFVVSIVAALAVGCSDYMPPGVAIEDIYADPEARALAQAAASGDIAKIDQLLDEEEVDVDVAGEHGITPLWWALASNNYRGFEHLLNRGADPNVSIQKYSNVMGFAARVPDTRFLELALSKGGDPDLRSERLDHTPIFRAIYFDAKPNMEILLDAGADIDAQDSMGRTPAMVAVAAGDYKLAYWLLQQGADPTITVDRGRYRNLEERVRAGRHENRYRTKILEFLDEDEGESGGQREALPTLPPPASK